MQIENLTDLINKTNIRAYVTTTDFIKGKQYDKNKITLKSEKERDGVYGNLKVFSFEVDSETKPTYYDVTIILENNKEIVRTTCDCKTFRNFQSCKHIGAVFVNYYEQIFKFASSVKQQGRIIAVFGSVGKKDVKKREIIGQLADKYCDHIILTEEDPRDEDPEKICNEIQKGIKKKIYCNLYRASDWLKITCFYVKI